MEIRFVDRVEELSKLMAYAEKGFYPILYLYGPEGSGKTRLLKEFYRAVGDRDDFLVVYVDAQSVEDLKKAVYAPSQVLQLVVDVAKEFAGPAGRIAALAILQAIRMLKKMFIRNKHVVVLVDDVAKPLGLDMIEIYSKNMLNLLEDLLAYEAKSVFILATTSEGVSRSILARHNYVTLAEIWNLDYSSFKELLIELGAPDNILYDVWKALGGNPRLAIALRARGWRLDVLEEDLYKGVKVLLESIARRFRKGLEEVVEDIDKVSEHPELGKHLLEANLIIPIDRPCIGYTPPIDKGMGIGKLYAWQTPLHQRLVGRYLEEQKDG